MTKNKILKAAKGLFAKNGYDATSISDVLAKSKLSKGALYYHFKSKEELFLETVQFAFAEKDISCEQSYDHIQTKAQFKKTLIAMGYQIIESQLKHPELVALNWEFLIQIKKNPKLKTFATKLKDSNLTQMNNLLRKGIELKAFSPKLKPQDLVLRLCIPLKTIGIMISFEETEYDYKTYWKQTVETLL